jgi:hypothetical protein
MFVDGGGRWEPEPDPEPGPRRRRRRPLPWRGLAWMVALLWLVALGERAGGLVAYGSMLVAITVGAILVDRAAGRAAWGGMRDHRQ